MPLGELEAALREDLEDHLSVIASNCSAEAVGPAYESSEQALEALACCKLLLHGDTAGFRRDLYWAATARRHYLKRSAAAGLKSATAQAFSRSQGWFCALAAGDLELAREIGDLSPKEWISGAEYQDDFCYRNHLRLTLMKADQIVRSNALDQFERALQGQSSPRLDLCLAIEKGATGGIQGALLQLLRVHAIELDNLRPQFLDQDSFEPRSRISTEGLGIIQLVHELGLGLAPLVVRHELCPDIAQLGLMRTRPEDLFEMIDRA